ncbi:hypothetical protein GCM10020219_104090 [Nonomuraea dietziae]
MECIAPRESAQEGPEGSEREGRVNLAEDTSLASDVDGRQIADGKAGHLTGVSSVIIQGVCDRVDGRACDPNVSAVLGWDTVLSSPLSPR